MGFKDYIQYDWSLISDSFTRTRLLIAPNWFVPAIIFCAGAGLHLLMFGEGAVWEEINWAFSGVTAVLLIGVIVFFWNLAAESYRTWKIVGEKLDNASAKIIELQEFIKKSSEPERHNVTLVDAVYYVAFGQWGFDKVIDKDREYIDNPTQNKLRLAIDAVRLESLSGNLRIWGLNSDRNQNILYEEIEDPQEFWKVYWPSEDFFKFNDPQEMDFDLMFNAYADKHEGYDWFYTSKQAVEKRWPPENILA